MTESELLIEYTKGPCRGQRTYISEAGAAKLEKLGRKFVVVATVESGRAGRIVPVEAAGERSAANKGGA